MVTYIKLNLFEMKQITSLMDFKLRAKEVNIKSLVGEATNEVKPIELLYSLNWDFPLNQKISKEELLQLRLSLDPSCYLGRTIKSAVLAEYFFPNYNFLCGEIQKSYKYYDLIEKSEVSSWSNKDFLKEILISEEIYPILYSVQEKKHFDPIFKNLSSSPTLLFHPVIQMYNLWECLYVHYLLSLYEYRNEFPNANESQKSLLMRAQRICPKSNLLKEKLFNHYLFNRDFNSAKLTGDLILAERMSVKIYWQMWVLTNNKVYKDRIIWEYSQNMFDYLESIYI